MQFILKVQNKLCYITQLVEYQLQENVSHISTLLLSMFHHLLNVLNIFQLVCHLLNV